LENLNSPRTAELVERRPTSNKYLQSLICIFSAVKSVHNLFKYKSLFLEFIYSKYTPNFLNLVKYLAYLSKLSNKDSLVAEAFLTSKNVYEQNKNSWYKCVNEIFAANIPQTSLLYNNTGFTV
jgi:hypothetical protein